MFDEPVLGEGGEKNMISFYSCWELWDGSLGRWNGFCRFGLVSLAFLDLQFDLTCILTLFGPVRQ